MLTKAIILKMGQKLGMNKDELSAAIDAETETAVEVPDVTVLTPDGKRRLESDKYNEGKTAGVEIAVKEYKEKHGLKFTGKSLEDLATSLSSSGDADTDERVKKLQKNLEIAEKKAADAEAKAESIALETETYNSIPADYGGHTKRELAAIAKANGIEIRKENGKTVVYRDGVIQRHENTQEDLKPGEVYKSFFETEKKMSIPGAPPDPKKGRGGEGTPPKGKATYKRSEIEKEWKDANPNGNVAGMEYMSHFASKVKELKDSGQTVEMD